jgi:hypothetical protein
MLRRAWLTLVLKDYYPKSRLSAGVWIRVVYDSTGQPMPTTQEPGQGTTFREWSFFVSDFNDRDNNFHVSSRIGVAVELQFRARI